ncbi:MAG: RluA family pseudouridine synthase [Eubacteriales bacterium]|jgi:RluA family pseudouridine synthase|nr:RluA family pseudouridine synthase [Eubacteriales bacterium]MDD4105027.1 RluA family pseudouridine synthase [Eubacteriales bacterium]MDD4710627.1 RluA family pseudouridine synthase [Eubacteriales bacterium]NLO14502.1 RluA family pseudouridine synthase [Clostridiales bacterium]
MIEYRVEQTCAAKTIRQVALGVCRVSRGALSRLKFQEGILLNGVPAHTDQRVRTGDILTLVFREPVLPLPAASHMPLDVAYEDAALLVVIKPAPLPAISSRHQSGETLQNRVFSHLGAPRDFVYRPVNRLDKGTSGLMLIAKNAHIHQLMQRQLHSNALQREYQGIIAGILPQMKGTIALPIGRGEGVKRCVSQSGRPSVTHYEVIRAGEKTSLVQLQLETGRTHQIRVHLEALGHPIVGDYLYGEEDTRLPGRFALHAARLWFRHPLSGEEIVCASPVPQQLTELLL